MKDSSRQAAVCSFRRANNIIRLLSVIAAGAVFVAACSSGSSQPLVASLPGHGGGTPQSSGTLTASQSDQDMVDFSRCMRSHGVPISDPYHRSGHQGLSIDIPPQDSANRGAYQSCGHFLQPIVDEKQAGARRELAAWLPALTRYAQCMRSRDIAMLDPNSQGSLDLGRVPGIATDFGRNSPQFRTADAACRHLLPTEVHDSGAGP
jgi:hypothetical protein